MPHANKGSRAPSRWSSDVEYLQAMSNVTPARSSAIGKGHIIIRRIDNAAHPAHGQMGLFASKKIPPCTHIIDYLGEIHTDERIDSDYDLSLYRAYDGVVIVNVGVRSSIFTSFSQRTSIQARYHRRTLYKSALKIDASRMGNEARFINDFRGIRSKPNAVFKERRTEGGELRMSVWTNDVESISKGDEIVVSYGKAWWRARQTC